MADNEPVIPDSELMPWRTKADEPNIPDAELYPWRTPEPSSILGEVPRGLKAGLQQLRGFGYGVGALAGEATGVKPLTEWAQEGLKDVEEKTPKPAVGSFKDIESASDAAKYLTYGISANLPNMALSLATGGVGGAIGKKIVGDASKEIVKKAVTRGFLTGAGAASIGMETGTIAADQLTEAGKVNIGTALLGGSVAGLLDVVPEWYLVKRLGLFGDPTGAIGKGIKAKLLQGSKEFGKQFAMEAPTEAMQSVIERAAIPGKSISNAEAWDEYINSFVLGGATGGVVGGIGGMVARRENPVQKILKDQPLANDIETSIAELDTDGVLKTAPPILEPATEPPVTGQPQAQPGPIVTPPPETTTPTEELPLGPAPPVSPTAPEEPKPQPVFGEDGYASEGYALSAIKMRGLPIANFDITESNGKWFVTPKAEPVAEVTPVQDTSVFTRMPDEQLQKMAEQGVKGAVDEVARRAKPPSPTSTPEKVVLGATSQAAPGEQAGTALPEVIDEETYLTQHGASRQDIGDSALHKNIPEGRIRKRLVENQNKKDVALTEKRAQLRKEYNEKVEAGEIRPPTREERLIATANGMEDNPSVQAARRILEKKGIDWRKEQAGQGIAVETDPAKRQEIKNSIAEGEMILKSGKKISGESYSPEELASIQRSVDKNKMQLGPEEASKAEAVPETLRAIGKQQAAEKATPRNAAEVKAKIAKGKAKLPLTSEQIAKQKAISEIPENQAAQFIAKEGYLNSASVDKVFGKGAEQRLNKRWWNRSGIKGGLARKGGTLALDTVADEYSQFFGTADLNPDQHLYQALMGETIANEKKGTAIAGKTDWQIGEAQLEDYINKHGLADEAPGDVIDAVTGESRERSNSVLLGQVESQESISAEERELVTADGNEFFDNVAEFFEKKKEEEQPTKEDFIGKEETATLEGAGAAENFNLVNPETEIGTLESKKDETPTQEMFDQKEMAEPSRLGEEPVRSKQEQALYDAYVDMRSKEPRKGYSLDAIAELYEKAVGRPFPYRFLLPALEKLGVTVSFNAGKIKNRLGAAAVYDPERKQIILNDSTLKYSLQPILKFEEVMSHEAIHAIVLNLKETNMPAYIELKARINGFFKEVQQHLPKADYTTRSMFELVNEKNAMDEIINLAFTNRGFARWLNSIPSARGTEKSQTLWGRLKEIILRAVDRVTNAGKTKMDELNGIMDSFLGDVSGATTATTEKGEQYELPIDVRRTIGNLYSTLTDNPQNLPKAQKDLITDHMRNQGNLKWYDAAFSVPFRMAQKYKEWKEGWRIHGIDRPEKRADMVAEHVRYAESYLTLRQDLKRQGLAPKQIQESVDRVERVISAGDIILHDRLVALKESIKGKTGQDWVAIQKEINELVSRRRFSDAELKAGVTDEYGNVTKLNDREIEAYKSVRTSLDNMMTTMVDWAITQAFRGYRNKKWYNLLLQAGGVDLSKEGAQILLGKKGLNSAAINYAKSIKADIGAIFERIEQGITTTPADEIAAVGEKYDKLATKVSKELLTLQKYLGQMTGIKGKEELTKLTRELFSAYVQTRPQLKQIKALRNQMDNWIGFFPRYREQGAHKARLVEQIFDEDTGALVEERPLYSEMFNRKSQYAEAYTRIMDRLQKEGKLINGNLPENYVIRPEKVTVSPEMAFEGVNDVNMQRIFDDAISNLKLQETYYDKAGNKIDVQEQLRDAGLQAIADQFKKRGAMKSSIHRSQKYGVIKGYDETDLHRVLLNYISSMSGLMTKQVAAADFMDLMGGRNPNVPGGVTNPSMFAGLAKYSREMLRNDSKGDSVSGTIRSLTFVWYLGGLLKSAIVNVTQNPLVGFPELAKYMREKNVGGAGTADAAYATAMKDVLFGNLDGKENDLIKDLVAKGIAQDKYIRSIFEGLQTKHTQNAFKVMRFIAKPFSESETYNRKSAGLALFRVAYPYYLKQGLSGEEAYNKAFEDTRTFIDNVHYAYGKSNRPLWMQSGDFSGTALKTLYTFRGYTHNFLLRQAELMGQKDIKTLAHTMAYIAVFGGLMGLPFFKDLFEWIEKEFGYSPTKTIRRTLRGIGGETLERFGMSGLPSVLGANISGSLAVGLPWPIGSETPEDTVFGVYGGMLQKGKRAATAVSGGDFTRAATEIAPEFIRNPMVAMRESAFGKEMMGGPGMATTTQGRPMLNEEGQPIRIKGHEVALKALGFNPTGKAREQEQRQTVNRQEVWYTERIARAGARFRIAKINNDKDALKDLMKEVSNINEARKDRGIEKLVPRASVSRIIQSSRNVKGAKERREMAYKRSEL